MCAFEHRDKRGIHDAVAETYSNTRRRAARKRWAAISMNFEQLFTGHVSMDIAILP